MVGEHCNKEEECHNTVSVSSLFQSGAVISAESFFPGKYIHYIKSIKNHRSVIIR